MMKKFYIVFSLLFLFGVSMLSAFSFDPITSVSKTIVVCFTKDAIGTQDKTIDFSTQDGVVVTGLASFDNLAKRYQIVGLERFFDAVKVPTWNDNGIYMQNIYRARLASDDVMDAALAELTKDPSLRYAEFETVNRQYFVPNDPMVGQQYFLELIQAYDAWDYTMGSHDVKIAITDSGVKWNHPDLRANIWINPAEAPGMTINWDAGTYSGGNGADAGEGGNKADDLMGWNFYPPVGNNPMQNWPDNYHGTHVAGCAAAVGNNLIGVSGSCPIASIISCKGAPSNTSVNTVYDGYNQMKYAAEVGAHVINASWGGQSSASGLNTANTTVNYCTTLGALVVVAAGNSNLQHGGTYIDAPGDCTNALCVAATGPSDIKASFSDYGEPIDICAPGEGILSTIIQSGGYTNADGTSMASPVVAGVAGLVKSINPELTPLQLRQRLMMTADYIYDLNPNYEGLLGAGRVNAFAATMYDKIPFLGIDDKVLAEIAGDMDGIPNPGETVQLKIQLGNMISPSGLTWAQATNVQAILRCNYPGVTIVDSVAVYGNISGGSSFWNNNAPYLFQTVSNLPSVPIPFELVLSSNQDSAFPYNKIVPFNVELSLSMAGWPHVIGGFSPSSAIVYDLDGDGSKDVIYADPAGNIIARKADGSGQISGFPYNAGSSVIGSLALSNITGDVHPELIATLSNGNIIALSYTGSLLWSSPAGGTLRSGPVVADINGNGVKKIIVTTQNRLLVVLNADGTSATNFPLTLDGAMLASAAMADLNGNGSLDIVCGTIGGTLHAIDIATGTELTGFPVTMIAGSQNSITIANLDTDTYPEILVTSSTSGHLSAYNHDGSVFFQKVIPGSIKTSPVVADVNSDGNIDIIVTSFSGDVFIMNRDGQNFTGFPVNIGGGIECTPVVGKFDGDNLAGVIFGDTTGKLHSIRSDGTESANFPITIGGNLKISAVLCDLDGDSDLEIIIPADTGFNAVDIKRNIQSLDWFCYLGSYNRAGNLYQPTPNNDPVIPVAVNALNGNYPNPFNPTTTISFSIKDSSPVSIEIFNLKGQKVKTLVDQPMTAGSHSVVWNGNDNNNQNVSSGVYYYRMTSGKYSATKKMVLMK